MTRSATTKVSKFYDKKEEKIKELKEKYAYEIGCRVIENLIRELEEKDGILLEDDDTLDITETKSGRVKVQLSYKPNRYKDKENGRKKMMKNEMKKEQEIVTKTSASAAEQGVGRPRLYQDGEMKKVGLLLDIELKNKVKTLLREQHGQVIRDVMEREIIKWLEHPDTFEEETYNLKIPRRNNGFLMPAEVRDQFSEVTRTLKVRQTHVIECIFRKILREHNALS